MTISTDSDVIRAERRRLTQDMTGRMGAGLEPIRMEPPQPNEGLRSLTFGEGLDELTVQALRENPQGLQGRSGPHGEQDRLRAAARRARGMDDDSA